MLDDGDFMMKIKELIEEGKSKLEKVDTLDTLVDKEVVTEKMKCEVVVFTKAPPREYCELFMRFSMPCGIEGNGVCGTKLNLAHCDNYMTEEMLNKLGFIRLDYGDEGEPSVMFGRNFLVATQSQVDFGLGEMRIDITMLKQDRNVDSLLATLVEDMVELEEMSSKQKEKILEALDRKYKELKEEKPILEVLNSYMVYRKKLDEVMMRRYRLENKDFGEEEKERIIENGLPKKLGDPINFILPVRVNGTTQLSALGDTRARVSVMPYPLYNNLGLCNPRPYHSNLTMTVNTKAKAMGEVRNVRIQIGYQAYLFDFLVLDIPVDRELPWTSIPKDMGAKSYLENFDMDKDEDWLGCFKVGRYEDGNPKYGLVDPSFLEIENEMETALAMEAYFNHFKNIFVFKKLIDFLGSLPV
nr:DNA-directed DNA polymerase [Tanacetum cinerariifolium]